MKEVAMEIIEKLADDLQAARDELAEVKAELETTTNSKEFWYTEFCRIKKQLNDMQKTNATTLTYDILDGTEGAGNGITL